MLGHFKMDLKAKAEQYFETFSSKDLDGLASMFTDDIRLQKEIGPVMQPVKKKYSQLIKTYLMQ